MMTSSTEKKRIGRIYFQKIGMPTEQKKHNELSKSQSNALPVAPSHIAYEALYRTDTSR